MASTRAIFKILSPAFGPCPEFGGACGSMRWIPDQGHVPRGFYGAFGKPEDVELVLIFAEPGDPHPLEKHHGYETAVEYTGKCFQKNKDLFHRNVRQVLNLCWPNLEFEEQMQRTWLTESVLCSAHREGGKISREVETACGERYLKKQLELFRNALVVTLGNKAERRLRQLGITDFLAVAAVAPPGCNLPKSRKTWEQIPKALKLHLAQREP